MNDSGGRLISGEGENCPGCLLPYTSEIGNSPTSVKRRARMLPGCSHNLCENCIAAEGDSTGQVSCQHPGCSTKVEWTGAIEEFLIDQSTKKLTEPKELGRYNDASSCGVGGAKHKKGSRSNTAEEMILARRCHTGCGKDIKKSKIQLMCACGQTIYYSEDCQKSTSHRCYEINELARDGASKLLQATLDRYYRGASKLRQATLERYYRDRAAGRGPSSDSIKELVEKIRRNEGRLLSLAEDGDPIAAYLIGSAYYERRYKRDKSYEDMSNGKAIRPLGHYGLDYMWFGMPPEYLQKSILETTEISIKFLKVAAEGGVPEAMYLLFEALSEDCGLKVDQREAHYWLDQAYRTGKMEYLIENLCYAGLGLAGEFASRSRNIEYLTDDTQVLYVGGESLLQLLLAARWKEIKLWGGKTAKGEELYGWVHFNEFVEKVGGLEVTDEADPFTLSGKSIKFKFVSDRPGADDVVNSGLIISKERDENSIKFKQGQGKKMEVNPDFQLIQQGSFSSKGRTAYLVSCKHDKIQADSEQIKKVPNWTSHHYHIDHIDNIKKAGDCQSCVQDAFQRLRSVAEGQYSISLTQAIPGYGYAARYVTENGVIVQDIFRSYSKPDLRQVLQCLMSNPADLHPLAVAEDVTLYWGIIWYWGSVYKAVQDTCNKSTQSKIFGKRFSVKSGNSGRAESGNENVSGLAPFPESAAGEWRFACGNESCNKVDHEVKFMVCAGCTVRRYCSEVCQEKDWNKHKKFCKAAK